MHSKGKVFIQTVHWLFDLCIKDACETDMETQQRHIRGKTRRESVPLLVHLSSPRPHGVQHLSLQSFSGYHQAQPCP